MIIIIIIIIRRHCLHAVHKMRPVNTDVARSMVCVSVSVGHMGQLRKHGRTDEDALWADSCGSKKPCIRWGQDWRNSFSAARGDKSAM